ncbi:MAG TPA: PHP domain-containing protein [Bryobacteraceae bacterium]|nr:PHP domain-containing protein [Bryobacteraceae bacterium]
MPALSGFIDLHSHTNESDGTLTPLELITLARTIGLDALAITDHDTFAGYDLARPIADRHGFDLIRGIELNTRFVLENGETRSPHLLAYFPGRDPSPGFMAWLKKAQTDRRTRNNRLADALAARGIEIGVSEVEALGRSLAGRPHFARLLVEKGYASDFGDAFRRYLGESAPTYVERESHSTVEAIQTVRAAGGVPVIAHPIRLSLDIADERKALADFTDAGLLGLEVFHSEHSPELQVHYRRIADELGLIPTGGSDFHGAVKPKVALGTGINDNIRVPREFLDHMRLVSGRLDHSGG